MRMLSSIALMVIALAAGHPDLAAASADRAQFQQSDWPYLYYLSTASADRKLQPSVEIALKFVVPSVSKAAIIEHQMPQRVGATNLYRIDLRGLEWSYAQWAAVMRRYPYSSQLPLIVEGRWLVTQLTDAAESDAQYRLLYGDKIPKTRDDFLKFWRVDGEPSLRFGLIESQSGVSIQGTRWIENRPISRGYAWGTRDIFKVDKERDPLVRPEGTFKHDGEEWIVGIPKLSSSTGARGTLQVYLLANGQGNRVDKAPVNLVEDTSRFRGLAEIRNTGSCIQCHAAGINQPNRNALRDLVVSGVDPYAKKKDQEAIERFHFGNLQTEINRNGEDFATIVEICTGVKPPEAVAAFKATIGSYDAPVSLGDAARELYTSSAELRLALANYSLAGPVNPRLALLAHDQEIPREAWDSLYLTAQAAMAAWERVR